MIDNAIIAEIERLLTTGISQRKIAERIGVSNTTVSRVASRQRQRVDRSDRIDEAEGPLVRCPKCGGRTRLPCAYCQIVETLQSVKRSAAKSDLSTAEGYFCQIELVGEQRRRYEKIRAWRSAQPNPHFIDIPENWPWRAKTVSTG